MLRMDVTNFIKQLLKAAIDKGRMQKALYPTIKEKVRAGSKCVCTQAQG